MPPAVSADAYQKERIRNIRSGGKGGNIRLGGNFFLEWSE
jgi:hypothetical protein